MNALSPAKEAAPVSTTREDWTQEGLTLLVEEGAAAVKILTLAQRLGCSRSSFYWFFRDRDELLRALLDHWSDHSTETIVERAGRPCTRISEGVLNIFDCWADLTLFDPRLDFAVREWARRDDCVKEAVESGDAQRLAAITALFDRFPGDTVSAAVRARTLYFMQIGYYALGLTESMPLRMAHLRDYVTAFCGEVPTDDDVAAFMARHER